MERYQDEVLRAARTCADGLDVEIAMAVSVYAKACWDHDTEAMRQGYAALRALLLSARPSDDFPGVCPGDKPWPTTVGPFDAAAGGNVT